MFYFGHMTLDQSLSNIQHHFQFQVTTTRTVLLSCIFLSALLFIAQKNLNIVFDTSDWSEVM